MMSDLTTLQKISLAFITALCLGAVIVPWLSLTSLNKLDDIADELRKIREALERRKG